MTTGSRAGQKLPQIVEMSWDPITRIIGNLGVYTKIDFANRVVTECHSTSSLFRGYSVFMKGKDPRDAGFITSRICGICGDNHTTCSVYAQNMAYGITPPPQAENIINLGEAAEYMFDHTIFQDNLVFVDFCEAMVKQTNPSVLARAENTEAPHAGLHGYRTIADIMRSFNPFEGEFYRQALKVSRTTREMFCLMEGRHVHPSTVYPGGVGTTPGPTLFTDYVSRLVSILDFVKRSVAMNDDMFDFFYEALPGYEEVGRRRILLGCWGAFQNSDVCDYRYETMNDWGKAMYVTPGRRGRRQAGDEQPGRHQPGDPDPAGQLLLRRLGQRAALRHPRPPGQPGRHPPPLEPDDPARTGQAGLRRPLQLGDEPTVAASGDRGASRAGHRRWPVRPALHHRAVRVASTRRT